MTTIALDVTHYSYRVIWSAEDEEFLATCIEFLARRDAGAHR